MGNRRWLSAVKDFEDHLNELDWSRQTPSQRAILEAFLRLVAENGFNAVSMRMIAKEMDLKPPTLYAHFPDGREEIVAESLRWHFYRFGTGLVDQIRDIAEPEDGWSAMVRVHVTGQVTIPESNLWDLLVATDELVHFLPEELRKEMDDWIDLYEALYRGAAQDLGYRTPARAVKMIMTILEGASRWITWDGNEASLASSVDEAVIASRAVLGVILK